MFAAMLRNALANIFYIWGLPTLALPFCMATFPLLLNQKIFPAFRPVPVVSLTVPEDHLNRVYKLQWVFDQLRPFLLPDTNRYGHRSLAARLSPPCPALPRLAAAAHFDASAPGTLRVAQGGASRHHTPDCGPCPPRLRQARRQGRH